MLTIVTVATLTVNFGFEGCALPSCNCLTSFVRINFGNNVALFTPGGNGTLNFIYKHRKIFSFNFIFLFLNVVAEKRKIIILINL